MSTVPASPSFIQACYTFVGGMFIREDGKTRPAKLDEIERAYTQATLDKIMEQPGAWITLAGSERVTRCRCWRSRDGMIATVITPGIGKLTLNGYDCISGNYATRLKPIFDRIGDAEIDSWKWHGDTPPTRKAFVELTDAEIRLVQFVQPQALAAMA